MTCREWLMQNGYEDVAALIDEALKRIAAKGRKSRRNWWDTLAGGPGGKGSVREGITFPVLRVAQSRQGRPITANAICRNENERPPEVVSSKRWAVKKLPVKARKLTKRARSRDARAG